MVYLFGDATLLAPFILWYLSDMYILTPDFSL